MVTPPGGGRSSPRRPVSIPQSGFLVVTREQKAAEPPRGGSFNPSVGILGGHTHHALCQTQPPGRFQSLSRDSWWSHQEIDQLVGYIELVSIPQSGFLVVTPDRLSTSIKGWGLFQSLSRDSWWSHISLSWCSFKNPSVSIPQSGFLVVTQGGSVASPPRILSFNPSVGILGGHTLQQQHDDVIDELFQSLSRDSWWSHKHGCACPSSRSRSFNPSVGILGGHTEGNPMWSQHEMAVSIPQSGFLVVTPHSCAPHRGGYSEFQSLSRDSWWSHVEWHQMTPTHALVSIPQSGFLVVTPLPEHAVQALIYVSIPQSGFLVVTLPQLSQLPHRRGSFV